MNSVWRYASLGECQYSHNCRSGPRPPSLTKWVRRILTDPTIRVGSLASPRSPNSFLGLRPHLNVPALGKDPVVGDERGVAMGEGTVTCAPSRAEDVADSI